MKKTIVIANARKMYGKRQSLFNVVINDLISLGHHLEIHSPATDYEVGIIINALLSDTTISKLLIAGGDGFISLVLHRWKRHDIPLAFIPLGTCNLFATECGYSKNRHHIVSIINYAYTMPFYCGIVNERIFLTTAGCGVDSYALHLVNYHFKRYLGRFYLLCLLIKSLITKRPTFQISIDNQPVIEASSVCLAKGRFYCGLFNFAPQASIFEPTLYVLVYKSRSIWHEACLAVALFRNKFNTSKSYDHLVVSARSLHILGPKKFPVQVDGDVQKKTPVQFSLENKPRLVCTPFPKSASISKKMDRIYRWQIYLYDALRKYYLLGRDHMINSLELRDENVCEIGCGTGRNLISMANRYQSATFWGIDVAPAMINYARKKVIRANLQTRISIVDGDASAINLAHFQTKQQPKFDRIILSYTLSMITDFKKTIDAAVDNIKPGGLLHIVDFGSYQGGHRTIKQLHKLWLSFFGVQYQPGIFSYLQEHALNGGGQCNIHSSPKHYYDIITFQKGVKNEF